ncbi:MAG: ClpX C4-type zinc finger protein, partial [Candidatus Acidiferrales bacterium]
MGLPAGRGQKSVKRFTPEEPLRCSFCHKTQEQVEKLISS